MLKAHLVIRARQGALVPGGLRGNKGKERRRKGRRGYREKEEEEMINERRTKEGKGEKNRRAWERNGGGRGSGRKKR